MRQPSAPLEAHGRVPVLLWATIVIVIAWALYRPDRARPFDILDFGEFVPLLKGANGWWEQLKTLIRYSVDQHGRATLVQMLAVVMKWRLFGDWSIGWQLSQFALMVTVAIQSFVLVRRLGASAFGASLAASIFLFAPAASRGWVRLTMGEPIGMICLLALALRATGFQHRKDWSRDVWWFAGGCIFVILTKELMAPALLLPLGIALALQPDGSLTRPEVTPRNVALVAVVAATSILTLAPLVAIQVSASSNALSSQYGSEMQSLGGMFAIWVTTFVPFNPVPAQPSLLWAIAATGLIGLVAAGWWLALHGRASPQNRRRLLLAAVLTPLLGVLSYAPWPAYEERYAFPYLIGPCLLLGLAATELQQSSRKGIVIAALAWLACFVLGGSDAFAYASRAEAVQRAVDEVVETVASERDMDSVFVATDIVSVPPWTGLGQNLWRLADATDRPWPPLREIRCAEVAELRASRRRTLIVAFAAQCVRGPTPTYRIATPHKSVDWRLWGVVVDSVRADVFVQRAAPSGN